MVRRLFLKNLAALTALAQMKPGETIAKIEDLTIDEPIDDSLSRMQIIINCNGKKDKANIIDGNIEIRNNYIEYPNEDGWIDRIKGPKDIDINVEIKPRSKLFNRLYDYMNQGMLLNITIKGVDNCVYTSDVFISSMEYDGVTCKIDFMGQGALTYVG